MRDDAAIKTGQPALGSINSLQRGPPAGGFEAFRKRCEEEYHVWVWAIRTMRELGIEPDAKVHRRFQLSMRYAVDKAVRRGIKELPEELTQFADQPLAA